MSSQDLRACSISHATLQMAAVGTMHLGDFTLLLYPNFVQEDCILHNKTTAHSRLSLPFKAVDTMWQRCSANALLRSLPGGPRRDILTAKSSKFLKRILHPQSLMRRKEKGGGEHGQIAPLTLCSLIGQVGWQLFGIIMLLWARTAFSS